MTKDRRANIACLQVGHAVAALAVVLHHATLSTTAFVETVPASFGGILEHGYLGVDFFFVLSGFIIFLTTQPDRPNTPASPPDFFEKRLTRIFVPYLPVAIGLGLLYTAFPDFTEAQRDWSWVPTLTLLPWPEPSAFNLAWTLQHELVFYAVFGASFYKGWLRQALIGWAAVIAVCWLVGAGESEALAPIVGPINLEFVIGVGCAALILNPAVHVRPSAPALGGLVATALFVARGSNRDESLLVGIALACLLLVIVPLELQGRLRVPEWLVLLGGTSYALYLVHDPIVSVVTRGIDGSGPFAVWPVAMVLSVGASIVGGICYHKYVERPATRVARRALEDR